jgi:hypothetical protein
LSVVALIELYFKLIICITIPEEPLLLAMANYGGDLKKCQLAAILAVD